MLPGKTLTSEFATDLIQSSFLMQQCNFEFQTAAIKISLHRREEISDLGLELWRLRERNGSGVRFDKCVQMCHFGRSSYRLDLLRWVWNVLLYRRCNHFNNFFGTFALF
mgnify:CR=1 FL=1